MKKTVTVDLKENQCVAIVERESELPDIIVASSDFIAGMIYLKDEAGFTNKIVRIME